MKRKEVPILPALVWGFQELRRHLKILIPMSLLFFIPEFSERFGYAWMLWAQEIYKTIFFFVLLLRAIELTKPKDEKPNRGQAQAFATGEILKGLAQGLATLWGAGLLFLWMKFRNPAVLDGLFKGGWSLSQIWQDGKDLWAWWQTLALWEKGLDLCLLLVWPLEAHVLFNFFGYIVAEEGLGGIEALRESVRLGRGAQFQLLIFYALCATSVALGVKLYVVGAVFSFPATVLATIYVYRSLREQSRT
jgi:hypothetical protein